MREGLAVAGDHRRSAGIVGTQPVEESSSEGNVLRVERAALRASVGVKLVEGKKACSTVISAING